jgi:hypothetical protein
MMRKALSLLLLVATALGLYNVYSDNTPIVKQAELTACGEHGCVRLLRSRRTPLAKTFTFQTSRSSQRTSDVECGRAYVLVGDVSCAPAAAAP